MCGLLNILSWKPSSFSLLPQRLFPATEGVQALGRSMIIIYVLSMLIFGKHWEGVLN